MTTLTRPEIDALLTQAVQEARKGNMAEACKIAQEGLSHAEGEAALPLHAFLGMVEARGGNTVEAAAHLRAAHALRPQDITIACNLISALIESGEEAQAYAVATPELMRADPSLRVARIRGFLAQQQQDFAAAVEAYDQVLKQDPRDFECLNNIGNAYAGLDDYPAAAAALRKALEVDPRATPTYLNLANALQSMDAPDEARAVLEDATTRFPQDSRPPYQLYVLHKILQNQDEALEAIIKAAQRDPDAANMQLKLAIEHGAVRNTEAAEQAYRRTIELDPLERDAYFGLAVQLEHTNRESEFGTLIDLARANGLADHYIAFIEALELRRTKRFEEALERLALVPVDVDPIRTVHLRATLLDRLERTDEAFAAYREAAELMQQTPSEPLERAKQLRENLAGEIAMLTPEWRDSWQPVEITDALPDPVFLMGFPRSGTTLLDTLLMGHPGTVVMEEQPPLNKVEEAIGGMAAVPDLGSEAVARARAHYFEEVAQVAEWQDGQLLIDKSPLFLYRIPLIKRLFPNAKIILALRHPCDVVLSCYMSNFRLNSAMANFLRLEDAAAFYDVCFGHWSKARDLFEVDMHQVVYEDLVADVEATVRPLVEWLGLAWTPDLLDHTATARSRGLITTASYSQVTEPIYSRAKGRWLRYRKHLEPTFGTLAPWAERFGYGDPRDE